MIQIWQQGRCQMAVVTSSKDLRNESISREFDDGI